MSKIRFGQRFTRINLIRLPRLMNMMYKPSEIAEEIGVSTETVYRSYLPCGCPFTRDKNSAIWINGLEFADWARSVHQGRKVGEIGDNEAYCMRCRKAVPLESARRRYGNRYIEIYQGKCANCGAKINRAYAAGQGPKGKA
jgi:hypothetical protein